MNATDPVELTRALVKCESVTPADDGALDLLQSILEDAGFSCERMVFSDPNSYDVDNLYARIGTASPHLCFAGHTDVVPPGDLSLWTHPPFAGDIADGNLYGRGTADMKGGVAAFVAATLRYLKSNNGKPPAGSLSFLITGDEEADAINGTVKMLARLKERGEILDACLVGEPSNPKQVGDMLKIGRRGSSNCTITVHGKQGHVAYPQLADNPVPKLVHILQHLTNAELDNGSDNFEPTRLQTTILDVPNRATNVIPVSAQATFNIRYNDNWTRNSIEAWVKDTIKSATAGLDVRYDLKFSGNGEVFLTKPGPLVNTLTSAVEKVTGRKPKLSTGGGTSDARFIQDACPVVEFGLVNETIHEIDEHVSVENLEKLTKIYEAFIDGFLSSAT